MKLKNILLLCVVFYTLQHCAAQELEDNSEDEKEDLSILPFKDRLTFNMGGGFMFGTFTNINLQPQIGYRVTPNLTSGIGLTFQYFKDNSFNSDPFLIYGGNVFSRYRISSNLFVQAELQALQFNENLGQYGLIGGGYISPDNFYISAYYLVFYPKNNNAYRVPYVLRFGFMF